MLQLTNIYITPVKLCISSQSSKYISVPQSYILIIIVFQAHGLCIFARQISEIFSLAQCYVSIKLRIWLNSCHCQCLPLYIILISTQAVTSKYAHVLIAENPTRVWTYPVHIQHIYSTQVLKSKYEPGVLWNERRCYKGNPFIVYKYDVINKCWQQDTSCKFKVFGIWSMAGKNVKQI